ncbi:hypothetical protein PJ985_07150 [Streptomyces sp. ACA25]|uniref:nitroreductase family protein n=1 Tax=Streptomyces sp. ACA25 TaxID=3022596 RepID=UPI002307741F|nr:nitroreductase family protein [Streptomyces sp. ACA25]MDB1087340.1 hypothetical protein [Streptomyces sp. ACA25]
MPVPTLDTEAQETLLAAAAAAPSVHNTQPWRFRFNSRERSVDIFAVWERALPETDPQGRALHISIGAAVFNLRVAAARLGFTPSARLVPGGEDPDLLATVLLAGPESAAPVAGSADPAGNGAAAGNGVTAANGAAGEQAPDGPEAAAAAGTPAALPDLYEPLWQRHSSRKPFTGRPVPQEVLDELVEAAHREDVGILLPDEAETARLLELTADAERYNLQEPGRRKEADAWVVDPGKSRYGIPATALGPLDASARLPVREFTGAQREKPATPFEPNPRLLLLSTRGDGSIDWLKTGQGLEYVLLLLTAHGLRASLLHQATEWTDLRWLLRDPLHGRGTPQTLVRIGYGPEGAATPRDRPEAVTR